MRTVQTITDLQNALKSEDDIQIVVPNELLETAEFKTFISNFNSFPMPPSNRKNPKTSPTTSTSIQQASGSNAKCSTPNNTPVNTRPPSVEISDDIAIFNPIHVETKFQTNKAKVKHDSAKAMSITVDSSLSPQPGPSRESNSIQSSPSKRKEHSPEHQIETDKAIGDDSTELHGFDDEEDEDEDDITLQDLVAMETMDDADELDMNSENSLQNDSDSFDHSNSSQVMARRSTTLTNAMGESPRISQNFSTDHLRSQLIERKSDQAPPSYQNALVHLTGRHISIFKDILPNISSLNSKSIFNQHQF